MDEEKGLFSNCTEEKVVTSLSRTVDHVISAAVADLRTLVFAG